MDPTTFPLEMYKTGAHLITPTKLWTLQEEELAFIPEIAKQRPLG